MKTTFKTAAALLLTLCATSIHAQSDDFGMDFSLSAEKKLTPAIELSVEGNARTQDNTSKMDRWSIGAQRYTTAPHSTSKPSQVGNTSGCTNLERRKTNMTHTPT